MGYSEMVVSQEGGTITKEGDERRDEAQCCLGEGGYSLPRIFQGVSVRFRVVQARVSKEVNFCWIALCCSQTEPDSSLCIYPKSQFILFPGERRYSNHIHCICYSSLWTFSNLLLSMGQICPDNLFVLSCSHIVVFVSSQFHENLQFANAPCLKRGQPVFSELHVRLAHISDFNQKQILCIENWFQKIHEEQFYQL